MSRKIDHAVGLYLEGIRDGNYREAVEKHTGTRYTQHSTGVKDGREGFIEFFRSFTARNPVRDIRVLRSLVDGPYVFLHVLQDINHGETRWVTTDFFDTDEDDLIVEHWDVIAEYAEVTPSGNSAVDGPTDIKDRDKTEENKSLVRSMIEEALISEKAPISLDAYISSESFIQHSKDVADGINAFRRFAASQDRALHYREIVLLVGEGNFVATLCRADRREAGSLREYVQVDLFRVEDGKIVERWDNSEPVPEENVNSGKF